MFRGFADYLMLFHLQNPSKTKVVNEDSCESAQKRPRLMNEAKRPGESSGSKPPRNGNHKVEIGTDLKIISTSSSDRSKRRNSSSGYQTKGKDRSRSGEMEKNKGRSGSCGSSIHKTSHSIDKELKIGRTDREKISGGAKASVENTGDVKVMEKDMQMKSSHDDSIKKDLKLAADVVVKCLGPYYSAGRIASKVCGFVSYRF